MITNYDPEAEQNLTAAERKKRRKKAKKQAKKGCAAIEDSVVYGWAAHYYQEDDIKVENVKAAKVVTPKAEKPKEVKEIKPIKALVRDKKEDNKCVQLDLFGGF